MRDVIRRDAHPEGGAASSARPTAPLAPASFPALLARADAGLRERLSRSVQRTVGNRAMSRMLAVQRWTVPAPADASCPDLISSINSNSPYSPEWAKTQAAFPHTYDYTVSGSTARVINGRVNHTAPVDMPSWSSSDPAMQTAWTNAHTTLRSHERQHQNKAQTWEGTLQQRLNALSVTFSDPSDINGLIEGEWDGWLADHQADQDSIDPFTVNLACPTPTEESTEGGEATEESASPFEAEEGPAELRG